MFTLKNTQHNNKMNQLTALITLAEREVSRIFRVWRQTLIPPIITASLYILIFGYSLGDKINLGTGQDYMIFIFPGLLLMGVITSAYSNSSFSLFINKFHRSIRELLASPMTYLSINAGYTIGSLFRAGIVAIGVFLVGLILAGITIKNISLAILIIFITIIIFSQFGILTAIWAQDFDQINVFTVFLITPLIYLGGVFYPVELLPPFWKTLSSLNPIYYLIDSFRYCFTGISNTSVSVSISIAIIIAISLTFLNLYLMKNSDKIKT